MNKEEIINKLVNILKNDLEKLTLTQLKFILKNKEDED